MGTDTVLKRYAERGRYDAETTNRILDESLICHVAFTVDGIPYNIPMIPLRAGSTLYVHTSVKSRFYAVLSTGVETCITATLLDGLVLAKSAYNSSMNYRSAMIFGRMAPVLAQSEKLMVAEKITEKMAAGRWGDCRQPSQGELKATGILKIPISTFSAKVRSGPPVDNPEDMALPYWSGVIPLALERGNPETAPSDKGKIQEPGYLQNNFSGI